ncbi:YKL222C [Kluyveromyces marxianus]|nr:YKL222C [Kluyveromyces marxianus]
MWFFYLRQLTLMCIIPLVSGVSQVVDSGTILGCIPPQGSLTKGFTVSYYHYPMTPNPNSAGCYLMSNVFQTHEYQHGGYETLGGGLIGRSNGVTNLTFHSPITCTSTCCKVKAANLPPNFNYDSQITLSNFTMLVTGYFLAPKSGNYKFIVDLVDDVTYMNIGDGKAFGCCQLNSTVSNPGPFDLTLTYPESENTATVNLLGGLYYPLRILFTNREDTGRFLMSFKDPDGVIHKTFDDYVFMAPDGDECPAPVATTTIPWTFQSTTTQTTVVTTSGSDNLPITENLIIVRAPDITFATTINTPWTETFTSTYSTGLTTTSGPDGIKTIFETLFVETPEIETAVTKVIPWTGKYTTTYSTNIATETGTDGIPTVKTNFLVETPQVETATTVNKPWTGTYTTTYSTDISTETGADGIPTVRTNFLVETPQVETATTINAGWTGTYTTTYSTEFVTVTGIDGIITLQAVYHVQTPTVKLSKFDNLSRTSNDTQAYSTNIIATTGADGVPTIHPTFSVDASEIGSISTVISPWTGTYTTTYSTELVTATGTDGIITVQAVYHVKTPSTGTINTKDSTWISNYIQTYPTGGIGSSSADGVSNVQTAIHVKTGEAGNAMKINIPWTGTYTTTYSTGAFTSTGSNGIQTVQTAFYVKTPEMGSSSFGYSNTSSTTSHGTDSNSNKNLQSETSKPLVKVSGTSGNVMGHSTAETNMPISQETSSNRPTTSKNDDGPVPERRSTANINTPLETTMNAVGETSGVVSGILDTETRGKQSKTMSISVGQPVTVSSATSKATSPQPSLNPSIPTFTPSISGASQTATFETRLEDKANKILISPLVIILLAFL